MTAGSNGVTHRSVAIIVHDIPGRLRLRLPTPLRGPSPADAVSQIPGVLNVAWTPRTGSLLVVYRPDAVSRDQIVAAVESGLDVTVTPGAMVATPVDGRPHLATTVASAVAEVDRGVTRYTRGALGLGTLVPLALVLWGASEVLRGRVRPLAWSSALWYAHGLFRDYALTPPEE